MSRQDSRPHNHATSTNDRDESAAAPYDGEQMAGITTHLTHLKKLARIGHMVSGRQGEESAARRATRPRSNAADSL